MSTRGLGRVLLVLVLLRGASISRAVLTRILWPDETVEVASNRLRVSLSRLRSLLGSAVVADRSSVRLQGVVVQVDLVERLAQLQDALDDVDEQCQFHQLMEFREDIRYVEWREFLELDASGTLRAWDQACREAIARLINLAVDLKEWAAVEMIFDLMRDRGELHLTVCERYLDACAERGTIDEGLRRVRALSKELGVPEPSPLAQSLRGYAQTLSESSAASRPFQPNHFHLLGSALLSQVSRLSESLGALMVLPEVQFHMQSQPTAYLQILESMIIELKPGSPLWIQLQSARVAALGSLYDHVKVREVCESLFRYELTPLQASSTRLHYSFSLFQVRRWDEAIASIQEAKLLALDGGEHVRADVCAITEAAYLWHQGNFELATAIYDDYLQRNGNSEDFTIGVNVVICRVNYGVIELVFGDISKAREFVDSAYGDRARFNLSRLMPNLLCLMSVVYARTGEVSRAVDFAVEGLKLTFARKSSREGQINMEWASGVLAASGWKAEAWQVMHWVDQWRIETQHTRSISEEVYEASLGIAEFEGSPPHFAGQGEYRDAMRFLIKCLRGVQRELTSSKVS